MPVELYIHPGSAPCRAVHMACKAGGVEIDLKVIDLMKGDHMKPEFLKINPQHCVPTITDGDFCLWESRAILRYLSGKYSKDQNLYPKDLQKRGVVDRLLDFDIGSLYKNIGAFLYPQLFAKQAPEAKNEENLKKVLEVFDKTILADKEWVTGDNITIADLSMLSSVTFLEILDFDISSFPNVSAWVQRGKALPYFDECNKALYEWKEAIKSQK